MGGILIGYPVSKAEAPSEVIKSIVNDVETVKSTFSMYDPSLPSFLFQLFLHERVPLVYMKTLQWDV